MAHEFKRLKKVIADFKEWKKDHTEEDYQYDEIHEFMARLSRGEMISFMDEVEELFDKSITA